MPQPARWLVFIEQYDYEVVHREAQRHGNADELSRRPLDEKLEPGESEIDERKVLKARVIDEIRGEVDLQVREDLPKRQQMDNEIGPIVRLRLASDERPTNEGRGYVRIDEKALSSLGRSRSPRRKGFSEIH